jgi:VIT1/CCC1 family predicted Fe2+/Mn2+ transporter
MAEARFRGQAHGFPRKIPFMSRISPPRLRDASRNGIATFVAFVLSGLVPLSIYVVPLSAAARFPTACALAGATLFGIGACRSLFSDQSWIKAGLEMLALGALASTVAYVIGALAAAVVS